MARPRSPGRWLRELARRRLQLCMLLLLLEGEVLLQGQLLLLGHMLLL